MNPRLLLWPAAAALGLLAESTSGLDVPDLLTGWTVLACGLVVWSRWPASRAGPLLAATGALWFAGNFEAAALYLYRGPLVHLLVTYPAGRARTRAEWATIAAGYTAAAIESVWASEPATLTLAALLPLAIARARGAAVGAERWARGLAVAAAAVLGAVLAGGAAARLAFPGGDADDAALLVLQIALCAIAVALAAGPRERPALTDLVVELGETRSPTLRDALAAALGDPTLEVGYRDAATGGYVDAAGRPLALPVAGSGRSVTLVEHDAVALVHDRAVLDDPPLVEAVATAAGMAASNERLQIALRAQVTELETSRRRILAAGAEQRRELEQRLQDGARLRLDELRGALETAHGRATDPARARIERAATLRARTDEDLEALGRGLHPRVLAEHGLAGALASLVESSPVPVELSVADERLAADVEGVVYFVCAEALANAAKHAHATRVTLAVRRAGGRLTLEIADDGAGGADRDGGGLRGLADRVEALDGRLRLDSPPGGGTRLTAELPI